MGVGVLVHVYVCGQKKLNRTLVIDSLFQTFAVLYKGAPCSICPKDYTITVAQTLW